MCAAAEAVGYFEGLGYQRNVAHNESEFVLNCIISQDRHRSSMFTDFGTTFKRSSFAARAPRDLGDLTSLSNMATRPRAGVWRQFVVLMGRSWRNYLRDRVGLKARLGQTLFFAIIISLVFANLEDSVFGVQDRQGLLFFAVLSMGLSALMQASLMFPVEKAIFNKVSCAAGFPCTFLYGGADFAVLVGKSGRDLRSGCIFLGQDDC